MQEVDYVREFWEHNTQFSHLSFSVPAFSVEASVPIPFPTFVQNARYRKGRGVKSALDSC